METKIKVLTNNEAVPCIDEMGRKTHGYPERNVKGAVGYAIVLANGLDIESRGHALDVLKAVFPDIYAELQQEGGKK